MRLGLVVIGDFLIVSQHQQSNSLDVNKQSLADDVATQQHPGLLLDTWSYRPDCSASGWATDTQWDWRKAWSVLVSLKKELCLYHFPLWKQMWKSMTIPLASPAMTPTSDLKVSWETDGDVKANVNDNDLKRMERSQRVWVRVKNSSCKCNYVRDRFCVGAYLGFEWVTVTTAAEFVEVNTWFMSPFWLILTKQPSVFPSQPPGSQLCTVSERVGPSFNDGIQWSVQCQRSSLNNVITWLKREDESRQRLHAQPELFQTHLM